MRYLCYLEDHEEFIEFKPDWQKIGEAAPRTVYLVPAAQSPFTTPSSQLRLPFSQTSPRASDDERINIC